MSRIKLVDMLVLFCIFRHQPQEAGHCKVYVRVSKRVPVSTRGREWWVQAIGVFSIGELPKKSFVYLVYIVNLLWRIGLSMNCLEPQFSSFAIPGFSHLLSGSTSQTHLATFPSSTAA